MKKLLLIGCLSLVAGLFAGTDYYVDAVKGNDAWDGSCGTVPTAEAIAAGGTVAGPKKTLAAACKLLRANQHDVLHAAPGDYNEGVVTNSTNNGIYGAAYYRVVLPATATLIATGAKEETFIYGASATINPDANGLGTNAVRCASAAGALIQGFMILNGRSLYADTTKSDGGCQGGGVVNGFVVDCIISNCCAGCGGGVVSTTAIRTCFVNNKSGAGNGQDSYFGSAYNCLLGSDTGVVGGSCYNCTSLKRIGQNSTFWNCATIGDDGYGNKHHRTAYAVHVGGNNTMSDGSFAATVAQQNLNGYRPVPPSVLIDAGTNDFYTTKYPNDPLVAAFKDQDFYGNPRIVDGQIDIGAIELQPQVTIVDASTGLTIEGAERGATTIPADGLTVSISRNYTTMPIVVGVRVGDEYVDFNAHEDGWKWTKTFQAGDGSATVEAVYSETREWYVDANDGDDDNDGKRPGAAHARKTLEKVMALATKQGDVVHAAAGVYDKGGMYVAAYGSNRVNIAAGVILVADEGPDKTFIAGKISTAEGNVNGCAPDSMRAVYLYAESVLKGFTIVNGRSYRSVQDNNANGGGAYGRGLCVDCCFSNNIAYNRGNAASQAWLLRCTIGDNSGGSSYILYAAAKMLNCVYDSPGWSYSYNKAYFTTFLRGGADGSTPANDAVLDCVFAKAASINQKVAISNCWCACLHGTGCALDGLSKFGLAETDLPIDPVTRRPCLGSLAIDKGLAEHYAMATNGWSDVWQSFAREDFAGGQRVYNGAIDVGAGEYDWRGNFAKRMRTTRDFTVVEAGAAVTTNAQNQVVLTDGCTLKAEWTPKEDDANCSFTATVTGEGSLTAMLDGTPLAADANGVYRFGLTAEKHELVFSFAGAGSVALKDFQGAKSGLMLLFR